MRAHLYFFVLDHQPVLGELGQAFLRAVGGLLHAAHPLDQRGHPLLEIAPRAPSQTVGNLCHVAEAMADIADAIFVQDGWGDVGEPKWVHL